MRSTLRTTGVKTFRKTNKKSVLPPRPIRLVDDHVMTMYSMISHCVQMSLFGDLEFFNIILTMTKEDLDADPKVVRLQHYSLKLRTRC